MLNSRRIRLRWLVGARKERFLPFEPPQETARTELRLRPDSPPWDQIHWTSFHQHPFSADRIGGKVSPLESGISRSSAVGAGKLEPSRYPSKRYRPDSGFFCPVLNRAPITVVIFFSFGERMNSPPDPLLGPYGAENTPMRSHPYVRGGIKPRSRLMACRTEKCPPRRHMHRDG